MTTREGPELLGDATVGGRGGLHSHFLKACNQVRRLYMKYGECSLFHLQSRGCL